jgi:hypothetical protein
VSGLERSGSVRKQVASSCEQGTEPSGSIKGVEYDHLSQKFFKKRSLVKIDQQYVVTYIKITFLQRVTGHVIVVREFCGGSNTE